MDERASDPDYYGKGLALRYAAQRRAIVQEINAALPMGVKASRNSARKCKREMAYAQ